MSTFHLAKIGPNSNFFNVFSSKSKFSLVILFSKLLWPKVSLVCSLSQWKIYIFLLKLKFQISAKSLVKELIYFGSVAFVWPAAQAHTAFSGQNLFRDLIFAPMDSKSFSPIPYPLGR
jgi:hypothetical protein